MKYRRSNELQADATLEEVSLISVHRVSYQKKVLVFLPLLLASLLWGFAFSFQSKAAEHLQPLTINALRFCVAGILMAAVALLFDKRKPTQKKWTDKGLLKASFFVGALLAISIGFQQEAMGTSTAGNGGFISNMDVVILPVLAVIFQRKTINKSTWATVALAVLGLFLISFSNIRFAVGDILMLAVAFTWALRSLTLDKYIHRFDPLKLSALMFLVVSFLSSLGAAFLEEKFTMDQLEAAFLPLLYLAVFSTVVAYTLETLSYLTLDPIQISLIINLEAIFAAIGGWILLGETISLKTGIGFTVLFSAIVASTITYQADTKQL